jgi:hypothetical protein
LFLITFKGDFFPVGGGVRPCKGGRAKLRCQTPSDSDDILFFLLSCGDHQRRMGMEAKVHPAKKESQGRRAHAKTQRKKQKEIVGEGFKASPTPGGEVLKRVEKPS